MNSYIEFRKKELLDENISDLVNTGWVEKLLKDTSFDIKEYMVWRNELGKLASHKTYIEDYYLFNELLIDYYSEKREPGTFDRLNYILFVVYHEQFYVEIIRKNIPDIHEIILDYLKYQVIPNCIFFGKENRDIMSALVILFFGIERLIKESDEFELFYKNIKNKKNALGRFFYAVYSSFIKPNNRESASSRYAYMESLRVRLLEVIIKYIKIEEKEIKEKDYYLFEIERFFTIFPFFSVKKTNFALSSIQFADYYTNKNFFQNHRKDLEAKINILRSSIEDIESLNDLNLENLIDVYLGILLLLYCFNHSPTRLVNYIMNI